MAYIESHQDLRDNPKVKRMARLLSIHKMQAIGHLQGLWWWALDHALDGDCRSFDALDLADAAEWEGDPEVFVKALIQCGPGDRVGFLSREWNLNDWGQYTQAFTASRDSAILGNHKRWHESRGVSSPECPHCIAPESPPTIAPESPPTIAPESHGESTYLTKPTKTKPQPPGDADAIANDDQPPREPTDGQTYSRTLADWAINHNHGPPDTESRSEISRWLIAVLQKRLPTDTKVDLEYARGRSRQVIVDYCTDVTDNPMPQSGWGILGRHIAEAGAQRTLDSIVIAVESGAGLAPPHSEDPLSLFKYATSVRNAKGKP